jgi:hypothetical protein
LWPKIERWFGTGGGIIFKGCKRELPQFIFMPTIQESGRWNNKGPGNGKTPLMETYTLKFGIPTIIVAQNRKIV